MKTHRFAALLILLTLLTIPLAGALHAQGSPETNLIDACVPEGEFDPAADYFPDKIELTYAENFTVAYFNNYKVITVLEPWPGAPEEETYQYVLVQCGTPAPDAASFADNAQFIEVPTGSLIVMSTTELPALVELDLLDHLVGLDSFLYANTPEVRARIDAGELVEIGNGSAVNLEVVLDADPDLVITHAFGSPDWDTHPILLENGIFVAINAENTEATLLGRAEWIKFMAAFYNKEAEAAAVFDAIAGDYNDLTALTASIPEDERVTALWNAFSSYTEAWSIPGQQTWIGALLKDAGITYVLQDQAPEGTAFLDFETVYEAGVEVPLWFVNAYDVHTLADVVAMDERYAGFAAVQDGAVYNDNNRVNENGGSDFWETGVTHPNLILADLVAIAYPDLLPDHELTFYRRME